MIALRPRAFLLPVAELAKLARTPNRHCFGRLHSAPVGWPAAARNLGLASAAAVVASCSATPTWEGEEAGLRFAERLSSAEGSPTPPQVFRALQPDHMVYGERNEKP